MLQAGKVIAATAIQAMENPTIIEQAKAELQERLDGKTYDSLIPDSVKWKLHILFGGWIDSAPFGILLSVWKVIGWDFNGL